MSSSEPIDEGNRLQAFVYAVQECLRSALASIRSHRMRSFLTMLGVIIGVASVVALVGVGQGTTSNITDRLAGLGTNLLTISPTGGAGGTATTLTLDDATAIGELDSIGGVAPEVSTSLTVASGDETTSTTVVGTTSAYASVRAYDVWQGTFLTDVAVDRNLRVVVLGASTATDLGLGASDIGTSVTIGGLPFEVIGILQAKGGSGFQDPDDQVMVPVGVVQKYFVGGDSVRTIGVSVAQPEEMDAASTQITALLTERHGLTATDTADFQVFNQTQLLEAASSISATLTLLLGGIASISLIVGGIGIMNIMLVSVRERTREIGIRKAVGARGRDILAQFLVEALTLSLLGGLIGIAVGLAASALIGQLAGWGFAFNPATIAIAVVFSLAVGVVFGVWPARQAARLDPITALRYE
jgi:putative ABC transport system permease protein